VFALLAGAALAASPRRLTVRWPAATLAALLAMTLMLTEAGETVVLLGTIAAAGLTVLVLAAQPAWLGWAPMAFLGVVSYGWYLWHTMFQLEFGGPAGSALSLAVAVVSWRFWESGWMRPKVDRALPAPARLATIPAGGHAEERASA
jgi:peptidoglycan/LPS O-acetylase OafA/YrhL